MIYFVRCKEVTAKESIPPARTSGLELGYSQIANPIYMLRKGTMTPSYALRTSAKTWHATSSRFLLRNRGSTDGGG